MYALYCLYINMNIDSYRLSIMYITATSFILLVHVMQFLYDQVQVHNKCNNVNIIIIHFALYIVIVISVLIMHQQFIFIYIYTKKLLYYFYDYYYLNTINTEVFLLMSTL